MCVPALDLLEDLFALDGSERLLKLVFEKQNEKAHGVRTHITELS